MMSSTIHLCEMYRSNPWGTSARLTSVMRATVAIIGLLTMAVPADALIIRDQCNQTSGDGQGNTCPPGDYVLLRPKDTNGKCHDWICCPANGDGSYNCEKGVPPTRSAISGALKGLLGPRATVLEPSKGSGMTRTPVLPRTNMPIQRRGVEGEQPTSSEQEGK